MLPRYDDVQLRTAHDVRHLTVCASCGGMGDKRRMLSGLEEHAGLTGYHHGRCVVQILGPFKVMALPNELTDKLTLKDMGPSLTKRLLNKRARESHD